MREPLSVKNAAEEPILVKLVEPEKNTSSWDRFVAIANTIYQFIKSVGAICSLILLVSSMFFDGRVFIASILKLNSPESPTEEQAVAPSGIVLAPISSPNDLSSIGWSYLGKADKPKEWYYRGLIGVDRQKWKGRIEEPWTGVYLRTEPISAANPNPNPLATVGDDPQIRECLRIVDSRESNTGSIWLQGAVVECL